MLFRHLANIVVPTVSFKRQSYFFPLGISHEYIECAVSVGDIFIIVINYSSHARTFFNGKSKLLGNFRKCARCRCWDYDSVEVKAILIINKHPLKLLKSV